MNKKEKLAAFEGIDIDVIEGNAKEKQIVKLFLQGMTYKAIAEQLGLSASRIGQILDQQAVRANLYKKKDNALLDYVIALTNLYGLVHKEKVVEIYNLQNEDKIDEDSIHDIFKDRPQELRDNYVKVQGNYFVAGAILEHDELADQLSQRMGKPFYIPEKEELLKYRDDTYFEMNKEYEALQSYVSKNIFNGDEFKAANLCKDVQGRCRYGFSIQGVLDAFNQRNVVFKNEQQLTEVMQLIKDLLNNTRLWENNGYTPEEIFSLLGKPKANSQKKIGRNDPCPCGSGKKFKKCCCK